MFESCCRLIMTGCTSNGKEIKDVFVRPKICLGKLRTIKKPSCQWRGCTTAGQIWTLDDYVRHYEAEISANMTINHNTSKPNQTLTCLDFRCI